MLFRTHVAIGVFFMFIFLPMVNNKLLFAGVVLLCSLLPDIDVSQSYLGKHKILRPIQWVVKHRGVFHSFTLAIIVALFFAFYFPIIAFSFFLGYSAHLIADSLTVEGIRPFWPYKDEIRWSIKTGGKSEMMIFYTMVIVDIVLAVNYFM